MGESIAQANSKSEFPVQSLQLSVVRSQMEAAPRVRKLITIARPAPGARVFLLHPGRRENGELPGKDFA
jgi:hypothetical protein